MYTPAGKWDLSATIQHQRVERGVKNWRANVNCRDNTGVPDEQTLLLWAQKCKRDGLKIFSLNALGQDITSNFSLSVKLWILLELLLLQILLILDHLDSWLPPVLCCVYERSAWQLLWLRAVKKHSLKNYGNLLPNLVTLKSKADDAEIRQSRCHPPDTCNLFFQISAQKWKGWLLWAHGVYNVLCLSMGPSHLACHAPEELSFTLCKCIWRIGIWLHDEIVPAPCSRTSNPTSLHHWVANWPYWFPAKVHFCVDIWV